MAIGDDFSVDYTTGNIRHTSGTTNYTVLEMHRWLQGLADNAETSGGSNDDLNITSPTPSERSTDQIITLLNGFNIDDTAAEYLYGGSIRQGSGATEVVYSGLQVLGSVATSTTQVQVVQDKALYDGDSPYWGNQTSPYNGGGAILMRILVKSREYGCDIDGQRIRVQIRNYGDSYAFFNVTLGDGEAVAAVSSVDDPQNDTAQGTVTGYSHVTNTEGYQQIDINDGNGNQPYYSKWTYGADTSSDQLKAVWEWGKDLTRTGTAKTIHGIDGELFLGISHEYDYDNEATGPFQEDEEVVWGTSIVYDTLAGGTFTAGNYVRIGASGAAGRIMYDDGVDDIIIALEDTTITLLDNDVITEYAIGTGATGVTAAIAVTINDNDKEGGSGLLLALDDNGTTGTHWIQLRTGSAPVDNLPVRGLTSGATADVNLAPTSRTVNPVFLGSYVGTLIGGFGIGVDADDLTNNDTVQDLDGDINTPPNTVTFTLGGLTSGNSRVLIGPKDVGNDFDFDQMTLATALTTGTETTVDVGSGNIPANTPATGTLRITLDDDRIRLVSYTSQDGDDEFTIPSTDFSGGNSAAISQPVMVSYIDKVAGATEESYTTVYTSGPQSLFIRVRDAVAPYKTFEVAGSLGPNGGSATAISIDDA